MERREGALESVVVTPEFWRGRRVLVTGHTGFKGGWLAQWLAAAGASVAGYALAPATRPSLFEILGLAELVPSTIGDINDRAALGGVIASHEPEIVLHLAAQALVRASYASPVETFAANVGGVVTLLDLVRQSPCVRAVVVVTSDKCYENREWVWGYRESDALGGRDPYSASKGCAEIAARSMQMSYFAPWAPGGHQARIATVRAGNVIGGGDWADDRLVPDIVRGCLGAEGEVHLRNPGSVRPWQHVLDPLAAYLTIAERLVTAPQGIDEAWNIGPDAGDNRAVLDVAEAVVAEFGRTTGRRGRIVSEPVAGAPHEAHLLALDCTKARAKLGWRPVLGFDQTIGLTAQWYAAWASGHDMKACTKAQIAAFEQRMAQGPASTPSDGRRS